MPSSVTPRSLIPPVRAGGLLGRARRAVGAAPGVTRVWCLSAVVALVAAILWSSVRHLPAADGALTVPWWALVLAFAIAEFSVVHVHFRRSAYTLTLGELPVVVGLMFAAPAVLAPAWAAGAALVLIAGRVPPVRIALNLAQVALTACIATVVFEVLSGPGSPAGPLMWAAAAVAVLSAALISALLIAAAMALSGERVTLVRLPRMMLTAVAVAGTNVGLGLAVVAVLAADVRAAPLLAVPAAAAYVAYRLYQSEREKTLGLQFLYEAERTLSRAGDTEPGLAGVLALALETFRAEFAEVVLLPGPDGGPGRRIAVGPDDRVLLGSEVPDDLIADLCAYLQADLSARIVRPDDLPVSLGRHLERAGVRTALLAGLPGDDRVVGAMLIANRLGVGGAFEGHDVRLLGMLAAHTGAALGHDRMERRIQQLRETQDDLYHQAFHDGLTGLANRLLFMDRVEHAMSRRAGNATVVYVDLDDFKPVNDTYGHDAGDALLCEAAARLRGSLRTADTAARLGGDEFAVLLLDVDPAGVKVVVERLVRSLEPLCDVGDGVEVQIKASFGVATADSSTMTGADLIRNADAAMYARKHGGKGGYSVAAI